MTIVMQSYGNRIPSFARNRLQSARMPEGATNSNAATAPFNVRGGAGLNRVVITGNDDNAIPVRRIANGLPNLSAVLYTPAPAISRQDAVISNISAGSASYITDISDRARDLSAALPGNAQGIDAQTARNIAESFNNLLATAVQNTRNPRFANDLMSVSGTYASALNRVGISLDRQGYMQVNEDALASAGDDEFRSVFAPNENRNFGLANRLANTTQNIQNDTVGHIENEQNEYALLGSRYPAERSLQLQAIQRNFYAARLHSLIGVTIMVGQFFNVYV